MCVFLCLCISACVIYVYVILSQTLDMEYIIFLLTPRVTCCHFKWNFMNNRTEKNLLLNIFSEIRSEIRLIRYLIQSCNTSQHIDNEHIKVLNIH